MAFKTLIRRNGFLSSKPILLVRTMNKSCGTNTCPLPTTNVPSESKIECMMDLLPVPKGCWEEKFKLQNKRNNIILVAGIVNLITSIICHAKVGFVTGYPEVGPFEKIYEYFE